MNVSTYVLHYMNAFNLTSSAMQRCVGPLVTSPRRSSSALWTQGMQDMGPLWTCECSEAKITIRRHLSIMYKPDLLLVCVYRWSSGVIMYTLLAGSPPFWHRKQMLMLRMILAGNYDFSSPEWEDRSDTVKDLVRFFSPPLLLLVWLCKMKKINNNLIIEDILSLSTFTDSVLVSPCDIWSHLTLKFNKTLHVVSSDLSDAGGGPKAALHSHGCSQPLVLFTVCGGRSATVQSIQALQGEMIEIFSA